MPTPPPDPPAPDPPDPEPPDPEPPDPEPGSLADVLGRAVAAGILTTEQAAAVAALEGQPAPPAGHRGAVVAEVLGYVGGALAVVAALFLGAELWEVLGPWPRVLLLAAVTAACLLGGAVLSERDGAPGRLGGFLWFAAVGAVAGTAGVAADDLLHTAPGTAALVATTVALALAVLLWWRRRAVLQHVATFAAAVATIPALLDRLGDATFGWGGPLLWALGLAWLAAAATRRIAPAGPGWVLGSLAVVSGPLAADPGRAVWLLVGVVGAAALVVAGVRGRRPWVAVVGTGGVFVGVPLAVAELFDARLGPLIGILVAGLALVTTAVVLTRRAAR
jgi:hypothetical protein